MLRLDRLFISALLLAPLGGCGYLIQSNKKIEYEAVGLGARRGDLWRDIPSGCPPCTLAFLISNWGEPASREIDSDGISVWTYPNGLKWVGGSPVVVVPLPLFIPSGKEKIQFGIKEGQIVFVRHFTVNRMFLYFPMANENNITGGLYYASVPSNGCAFRKSP